MGGFSVFRGWAFIPGGLRKNIFCSTQEGQRLCFRSSRLCSCSFPPPRRLEKNLGFCPQAEKRADSGPTCEECTGFTRSTRDDGGRHENLIKPYVFWAGRRRADDSPTAPFQKNPRADKGRRVADTPLCYKNQEIMWRPNTRWRSICYPPWSPKVAAVGRASH